MQAHRLILLNLLFLLCIGRAFAFTFDWKGTGTNWASASSWTKSGSGGTSTYPGEKNTGDIVRIGVTGYTTNQPTLSTALGFSVASIEFGANNGNNITLTVTGVTLTVAGNIQQDLYPGPFALFSGNLTTTLTGTGTVICQNFNMGDTTQPNFATDNLTILSSQINQLTINGNLTINAEGDNDFLFTDVNYPVFSVDNNKVSISGQIITTSANAPGSGGIGSPSYPGIGLFTTDNNANNTTVELLNASPISTPIATNFNIDFTNNGSGIGTVIYDASSGTQTVYTSATSGLGTVNFVYDYLTLSAASAKTVLGSNLTVGHDWNTSGGAVNLNTNNSTVTISGNWTNSASVTQGSGNISVASALTNSAGGVLNLGIASLTISGNYTNNGTYTQSTGNTVFNGGAQTLIDGSAGGTVFNNVIFNGSGTALMSSGNFSVSSTGVLTMANSEILNANGNLTLNSAATSSATVATIPSTAQIKGNVNVQRYLQGGQSYSRGYRLLSSPVNTGSNTISINYLKNSTFVTGTTGTAGGFDATLGINNPSLYIFRENLTPAYTTFLNSNYIGISNITTAPTYSLNDATYTTTTIPVGNGYLCFFRGSRSTVNPFVSTTIALPATLTATGKLNQGQVIVNVWFTGSGLSFTSSSPSTVRGYNLVGNPYASTINWDTFQTASTSTNIYGSNIGTSCYILDPQSHNYGAYVANTPSKTGTNHSTNLIASGQGFFVAVSASGAALLYFNEGAKVNTQPSGSTLLMSTSGEQVVNDQYLRLQLAKDTVDTDDIMIRFDNNAASVYNPQVDAPYKQGFGVVSLSSFSSDRVSLAVNMQPLPKKSEKIDLNISTSADGLYSLNMKEIVSIPQLFDIWLMDAYKKDSLDMRHNATYKFNVLKSDTNSFGSKRFSIVIRQNAAYAYRLLSFSAEKVPPSAATNKRQVQVLWSTENEANYTSFAVERSIDSGKTFKVLGSVNADGQGTYSFLDNNPVNGQNFYRLQQQDINGLLSYSAVVPVEYSSLSDNLVKGNLNVFPNPAINSINLAITTVNNNAAAYNILITNSSGLVIKQATSASPLWQTNISDLMPGTYVLKVINSKDNSLVGDTKFVKM